MSSTMKSHPGRFVNTLVALASALLTLGAFTSSGQCESPRSLRGEAARSVDAYPRPRELGRVQWAQDIDEALVQAQSSGRPIFLLFQEVPGCQTCVSFGDQVLSHPLLVEAIESEFIPVVVHNNRGGRDREVLQRFGEPAWANPVVRLLGADGRDLLPRKTGVRTAGVMGQRMIAALDVAGRPAPDYLEAAVDELRLRRTEHATFAMHCFWSGEACLGDIPGVLSSRAGFLAGREVVELEFDPTVAPYSEVLSAAHRRGCASDVFARSEAQEREARAVFGSRVYLRDEIPRSAPASDQKRSLRRTRFAELDLTERQAMRVNAAVAAGRSPASHLSPRQRELAGIMEGARLAERP